MLWLCLLILVRFCGLVRSQIPENPCPDIFSYKEDEGIHYGEISMPFDGRKNIDLAVNISMPGLQHENLTFQLELRTPSEEILSIPILECRVNFPLQSVIPKIVRITLNGKARCEGLLEAGTSNGVTYLWANIVHKRNEYVYNFQILKIPSVNAGSTLPSQLDDSSSSSESTCGMLKKVNVPETSNPKTVPEGQFPWLTAIFVELTGKGRQFRCSGSLISHKHVVMAAHCLQENIQDTRRITPEQLILYLGLHNLEKLFSRRKLARGQDINIHPDYVPSSSVADIAVVTLAEKVQFTDFVSPICVGFESDDAEDFLRQKIKVVGWKDDDGISAEPKQTTLIVVGQQNCLQPKERTFCTVGESITEPCNYNSGSGFVVGKDGRWRLKGIGSTNLYDGKRQCLSSSFLIYTDVNKFRTWILSIIT